MFTTIICSFLANVNSRSCSLYATSVPVYRVSVYLSETFVYPTQPVKILGNVSSPFGVMAILKHPRKILQRSSQGTHPSGSLSARVVVKYSDFGTIKGHIMEIVQVKLF